MYLTQINQIEWNLSTPHAIEFASSGSFITKIFTNSQLGQHHQFVSKRPLPSKGITQVKATIKNYGGGYSLGIGFLTQNRIYQSCSGAQYHNESVGYWTSRFYRNGSIWIEGQMKIGYDNRLFLDYNQDLLMQINMDVLNVSWWKSGQQIRRQFNLSPLFHDKNIYIFVIMNCNGDAMRVQLSQTIQLY